MPEWISLVDKGGTLVLLMLILYTGTRGVWVFRREFEAMRQDRDEWKALAQTGTQLADKAVKVAERRRRPRP